MESGGDRAGAVRRARPRAAGRSVRCPRDSATIPLAVITAPAVAVVARATATSRRPKGATDNKASAAAAKPASAAPWPVPAAAKARALSSPAAPKRASHQETAVAPDTPGPRASHRSVLRTAGSDQPGCPGPRVPGPGGRGPGQRSPQHQDGGGRQGQHEGREVGWSITGEPVQGHQGERGAGGHRQPRACQKAGGCPPSVPRGTFRARGQDGHPGRPESSWEFMFAAGSSAVERAQLSHGGPGGG